MLPAAAHKAAAAPAEDVGSKRKRSSAAESASSSEKKQKPADKKKKASEPVKATKSNLVAPYACATQCPLLTSAMLLPGQTRGRGRVLGRGTVSAIALHALSYRRYAVSSTDVFMALPGARVREGGQIGVSGHAEDAADEGQGQSRGGEDQVCVATCLRACSVLPMRVLCHARYVLRAGYPMPGTVVAVWYDLLRHAHAPHHALRCYALLQRALTHKTHHANRAGSSWWGCAR